MKKKILENVIRITSNTLPEISARDIIELKFSVVGLSFRQKENPLKIYLIIVIIDRTV